MVELVLGKTTLVLNEIKNELENGFDKPLIYIVPEQFSFEAEKKLIEISGKTGIMGAQVLSFKRLGYMLLNENNISTSILSSAGSSMLIFFIMLKLESKLQLLKGVSKNSGLVKIVLDEISEFKRYNLKPSDFIDLDFHNEYLNMKIHDLALIYYEYEKRINESYFDQNDNLSLLADVIRDKDKSLDGAKIWIDEFDGFIPQEMRVIEELDKKTSLTISMISDSDEIFELNNKNIDKLKKLAKEVSKDTILTEQKRFKNDELVFLERSLYKPNSQIYDKQTEHIYITSYNNAHEEIDAVARKILNVVRKNDARFDNIAVLTRELDSYKNIFKLIFPTYNIPYFIDDKKDLSQEPAITLVLSVFDILSKNYSYEAMFTYLKTGLLNIEDYSDIDMLENYVLKWGVHGKRWEEDFTIEDERLDAINHIRKEIVSPLIKFKNTFSGRKTVRQISEALFAFLDEIGVYSIINDKVANYIRTQNPGKIRIAQEYAQVWNLLNQIIDDMVSVIGDEQVSFEKYKAVLKIGISNHEISVIPTTKDQVLVGDIERTKNSNIKYLFIVGVNDGSFPKSYSSEGFINDKERELLLQNGIEIAKDTKMLLKQEVFNIYKSLTVPSEKLFLSYPTSDLEGKTKRPAFLIHQLKKMFPNLQSLQDDDTTYSRKASFGKMLEEIKKMQDKNTIDDKYLYLAKWYSENEKQKYNSTVQGLDYKNTIENQSKSLSKKLYGENMYTSVSRLESYVQCPFSFYLNYGLKIKEREIYKLGVPDVGTLLHEIIDEFSKEVLEENIDIRKITKEECDQITTEISNRVFESFRNNLFSSTGKLRNLTIKLKEQIKKIIWLIVFHIKSGQFNILGSEVEFGRDKKYPSINIELENGEKLILSGKIDRLDIAKLDDGNYLRIVDYKSSNKAIKLSNVYYGVQLQLLAYTDAVSSDNTLPAGAFYLHLNDPITNTNKRISKEEVEANLINALKMNGIVIANVKLIEAMDENFNGDSSVLNLKLSKEGNFSKMPAVTNEQFKKLRSHMRDTLKKIGEEILSGNICNEPLVQKNGYSPCSYCNYSKICLFERSLGNKARRLNDLKDEEVLHKIENE